MNRDIRPLTALTIMDIPPEEEGGTDDETAYRFADRFAGSMDLLWGTIRDVEPGPDLVLAGKAGTPAGLFGNPPNDSPFAEALKREIRDDPGTGGIHTANTGGELLIYNVKNREGDLGLPYRLKGRANLPYSQAYGVARSGQLALVANGPGGVIAFNIGNPGAPYRTGFIKPNGLARDVAVR
ncbi:MAG: hypothetical protein ABEK42_01780, partial [Thiohalorhabdaceae bacterium]